MFSIIFFSCLISVSKQTADSCSSQPSGRKGSTVNSDHCSFAAMEDIENSRNGDNRNANDFETTSGNFEIAQKNYEKTDKNNMALVLYNQETILPMHKSERSFKFVGREIKIQQNWSGLGVAAVVWDAVSYSYA